MSYRLQNRLLAVLIVLALIVSVAPVAAHAAPTPSVPAMMDGMTMNCDQSMPDHRMPDHQMPCDDGSTCLGMLGCAMAAVLPPAVMSVDFVRLESSWPPQAALDGLFQRPALPPPIA